MSTPNPDNSNHPFNIEFLVRTLTAQLVPQKGHDKARCDFDEDERWDGKTHTQFVQLLLSKAGEPPSLITVGNDLAPLQRVIGGTIAVLPDVGIDGVVAIVHDEALLQESPIPNRYIPAAGTLLFNDFLLAGNGINFHSLTESEIEAAIRAFAQPVTPSQIQQALRASDARESMLDDESRVDRELDEALDE